MTEYKECEYKCSNCKQCPVCGAPVHFYSDLCYECFNCREIMFEAIDLTELDEEFRKIGML